MTREKIDRNQRLYDFWIKNKERMTLSAVARIFHIRHATAWNIVKRMEKKIELH